MQTLCDAGFQSIQKLSSGNVALTTFNGDQGTKSKITGIALECHGLRERR
jgi:hypothetical protein